MNYKTPGVYVEEISKFPPSVSHSETAIPVFIGYTENKDDSKGDSLLNKPTEISSMLEYENTYGGPAAPKAELKLSDNEPYAIEKLEEITPSPFCMHPALNLFYANGGGKCYIVSTGSHKDKVALITKDLSDGLEAIAKNEEITLVVIPEASQLEKGDMHSLYQDVLAHCNEKTNRFAIFDLKEKIQDIAEFRTGLGSTFLDKGAAYFPHLYTNIGYYYDPKEVKFKGSPLDGYSWSDVQIMHDFFEIKKEFDITKTRVAAIIDRDKNTLSIEDRRSIVASGIQETEKAFKKARSSGGLIKFEDPEEGDLEEAQAKLEEIGDPTSLTAAKIASALTTIKKAIKSVEDAWDNILTKLNAETKVKKSHNTVIQEFFTPQFKSGITKLLDGQKLTMPPSPAVAGIYARIDATRGVWKSPANVSLNRITGPVVKLSISENDSLNDHPTGKSINAIRSFTGKGTLIWGARTLDGNSNEWRYISVRRFFSMVEESVKRETSNFIFEPNDANTWVKVKAMIENFLILQWRAGALMGTKPENAFFVKVGLGVTMDQADLNEGRMIVEIGMAVVRPSEFIVLRFSHKMLES